MRIEELPAKLRNSGNEWDSLDIPDILGKCATEIETAITNSALDIRPASELTPELLAAWDWWVIIGDWFADARKGLVIDGDVLRSTNPDGDTEELFHVASVKAYPCHDGQPWRPAPWPTQ